MADNLKFFILKAYFEHLIKLFSGIYFLFLKCRLILLKMKTAKNAASARIKVLACDTRLPLNKATTVANIFILPAPPKL